MPKPIRCPGIEVTPYEVEALRILAEGKVSLSSADRLAVGEVARRVYLSLPATA